MVEIDQLAWIVHEASARLDVRDAVAGIYAAVEQEVDARRPLCVMSGRCCRFEEFGHRLYVTTMELAAFVHALDGMGRLLNDEGQEKIGANRTRLLPVINGRPPLAAGDCPFQIDKLCGVHAIRPFGCRMFFCDATATQWQNKSYERFHAKLKMSHADFGIPYFYVEWRRGLAALGLLRGIHDSNTAIDEPGA